MNNKFKHKLAFWTANIVYFCFIKPYRTAVVEINKVRLALAVRKAIALQRIDGKKRFVVPVGKKYRVMCRQELKEIANKYRKHNRGRFVSWKNFYIASTK